MLIRRFLCLLFLILLAGCTRSAPGVYPPATDSVWTGETITSVRSSPTASFRLLPTRMPGSPALTPTPDHAHSVPTMRTGPEQVVVQPGDTLGGIASQYGVSVEAIMQANGLTDPNALDVGQVLEIPVPTPLASGPSTKLIPDSELVYGPMSITLDIQNFVQGKAGYLASYSEEVDGEILAGAEIVRRVALNYSVNPRLLLALLEYQSGWVGDPNPDPATLEYPLGFQEIWHLGLYHQLTWAADALNQGYYLWRAGGVSTWVLADGSVVPVNPTINAGTAGVQNFFAQLDGYGAWQQDVSLEGFFSIYLAMFGYPFDLAIEPVVPSSLVQPLLQLPFGSGEIWSFTGGPHGGWDSGSGWAALDFAPPGEAQGCAPSDAWVVAMADGLILRAGNAVIQDLDGDGYEQTGWVILYMHIETRDRIRAGVYLRAGERIGHPSCEGGETTGTHVHIARRINGEWIPADGNVPFVMDGWVSSGTGVVYDGFLTRGGQTVEAYDGNDPMNQIQR